MARTRREKAPRPPWTRGERVVRAVVWVAVVVFVVGAVVSGWSFFRTVTSGRIATPGVVTRDLGEGTWVIFQHTGTTRRGPGIQLTTDGPPTITPNDVRVSDGAGRSLAVRQRPANESIDLDGTIYRSALEFDVVEDGDHRITVAGEQGDLLVQRGLGDQVRALLPWLVASGTALLVVLFAGLPLIIRRSRRREAVGPGWAGRPPVVRVGPGAGWYPDPEDPTRQRWWDGSSWADRWT